MDTANTNRPILACVMIVALQAAACGDNDSSMDAATTDVAAPPVDAAMTQDTAAPDAQADAFPAPVPDDCLTDVSAGQHTFSCEGIEIEVSVPDACITSACGLIFDIHGAYMTASDEEANMNMRALGKQHGYIVVQPTAPATKDFGPYWYPLLDIGPLYKILHRVTTAWNVDLKRIHCTGFSQGGYMTWHFLCKYGDELASVAPAAAGLPCTPSVQTDVLFLAGRKDAVVPYTTTSAARDTLIATWNMGSAQVVAGDDAYTHSRYTNEEDTVFETLEHDYVTDPATPLVDNEGHCYPGSTASSGSWWDNLKCKPPNAFHWGEEAIKFFITHPKQ